MKIKRNHRITSQYLWNIFEVKHFKKLIQTIIKSTRALRKSHPFDAIAFTGTSGAAVAFPLSYRLGIPVLNVRKKKDGAHYGTSHYYKSSNKIEGALDTERYLIVDDMIETGKTIREITSRIKKVNPSAVPVAILLYGSWFGESFDGIPVVRVNHKD